MSFDPQAATAAYIDSLGADALAKAAAYTTGVRREPGSAWALAQTANASRAIRSGRARVEISVWTLGQVR